MIYFNLPIINDDTFCFNSSISRSMSAFGRGRITGTARENIYRASVMMRGMINNSSRNTKIVKRPIKIIGSCFINDTIPQEK